MEEKNMDVYDHAFRKRYGYWGWRYQDHLYRNNVETWYTLLERQDCDDFMRTLNEQCQFSMRFIMEELFEDKQINNHNIVPGLQRDLYRWIVNTAKEILLENCLELLKYAVREEKTDVILFPEEHNGK